MGDPLSNVERGGILRSASTIVFLCSGNMVRSAFAELYAKHIDCPLPVASAATIYRNDRIYPAAERALLSRGVASEQTRAFRPVHLDELLPELDPSVVFLGMRHHHLEALDPWAARRQRALLLIDGEEIADPVLEGADFETTFARVACGVEELLALLRE